MNDDMRKKAWEKAQKKEATIDEFMIWYTGDKNWGSEEIFDQLLCNTEVNGRYTDFDDVDYLFVNKEDKILIHSMCSKMTYTVEFEYKSDIYSFEAINKFDDEY